MPYMGGSELITRLKADWPNLKVVCMSGYTDRVVVHHGITEQCDAFLQKPFTAAELVGRVEEMLSVRL